MILNDDNQRIYGIFPALTVPKELLYIYWQSLAEADLLRYRLCDLKAPTVADAFQMIDSIGNCMYNVFDPDTEKIVADFALTNFTGKAAQVHFSMHPDNSPQQSMHYARTVTDKVLNEWGEQDAPHVPYLYALYGLTPVNNRAACAFVRRVGFKKIGVLPKGQRFAGEPVDAMITIKSRTEV